MCEQLLANPLIESYAIELHADPTGSSGVSEPRPLVAVVVFPGSNDDRDAQLALERLGADAPRIWHTDSGAPGRHGSGRPPGRVLVRRLPPLRRDRAVLARAWRPSPPSRREGGLVLGICNGFQVLTEAGLLPGVLRPNASLSFVCRDVPLTVERADTPFTSRCTEGQALTIPVKHGEGCWFADDELLAQLDATGQIALRYADGANPNGAVADVAGVLNARRQRLRADAASGARRRPAARLDRRRADPRLARRCCSVVARRRRLGASLPSRRARSASAGFFASAACRRSTSRARNVTGPRRPTPAGRVREADEPLATSFSSSSTTDANRRSPARCGTVDASRRASPRPTVLPSFVVPTCDVVVFEVVVFAMRRT